MMAQLQRTDFNAPNPALAASLSGPERAAVIMLALGPEHARTLWERFDDEELRELTLAITRLGSVRAEIVEDLLGEFADSFSTTGPLTGSLDSARKLLANALPADKIDTLLQDIKGPAGRTLWDKLGNVSAETLARYLSSEHAQTVAVILSRINPAHAAQVIQRLDERTAEEIINRMLTLGPVQKDVLDEIETALQSEFINSLTLAQGQNPHETMAEIFNNFERSAEQRFMGLLEDKNPSAADRIKSLMFIFDNLMQVDDHDIQIVIRHLDKAVLATALKGANEDLQRLFFSNMSERAAKILRDDIDIMRPLRAREVEQAQQKIVETAKQLSDDGKIYQSSRNPSEVLF